VRKPLAIVCSHPIQYQGPLYRYLAGAGLPLHVFFLDDRGVRATYDPGFGLDVAWDISLLDGYPHTFLRNRGRKKAPESFFGLLNPRLTHELTPGRFGALLIHGWRSASMLLALGLGRFRHIPVLYRADTSEPPDKKARLAGPAFRHTLSACLATGTLNRRFYRELGFPDERLFTVPHAVDNDRFQAVAASMTPAAARRALDLPADGPIVLFVGKLVRWKRPELLLEAFRAANHPDAHLVYVGDGDMRASLGAAAGDSSNVHFLGFLNQAAIPLAYRASDMLVLPSSHEPWGLAVNEAMNFGIPTVVSDRVGCGPDLVEPGRTGEVFENGSARSLAGAMDRLLSSVALRRREGEAALHLISRWGFPECAEGIEAALAAVTSR
jgi:glycosyltransferase involved in cell wall biosynthesis